MSGKPEQFAPLSEVAPRYDVVIAGGGIIGTALACALADGRRSILVLEANPHWCKRLAGELLHPAGVQVLRELGLTESLLERGAERVSGFAVYPEKDDGAETVLYYAEIADGTQAGVGVEHELLVKTLRDEAESRPGVTLARGKVKALIPSSDRRGDMRVAGVVATDRGGVRKVVDCTLLVGADGRQSTVRKLAGLDPGPKLISYSAGTTVDVESLNHAGLGHIFLGAWGPTLAYPMGEGKARLIFDLPPDFSNGRRDRLAAHLRAEYLPHLRNPLRDAVEKALDDPKDLQITPNYRVHAKSCWAPGVALAGDASGCMHPMTASGMTNGLNDVRLLAPRIQRYLEGAGDRALAEYDRQRRPFFQTRALLARALHEVFRSPDPGARALRRGVFERWRSNRTFRLRTMGLLAGTETSPLRFAGQYLAVVQLAARRVAGRQSDDSHRLRTLFDIGRQSVTHLDRDTLSGLVVPRPPRRTRLDLAA